MKKNIVLGAYGWRHPLWLSTFYPDDLPEDWQLTYFSNEFNAVLVPAAYWQAGEIVDCEEWMDAVHDDFQFFVECHVNMLETITITELESCLKMLQPQIVALVILDEQQMSESAIKPFYALADSLALDVFGPDIGSGANVGSKKKNIWYPGGSCSSDLAFVENDLSDLRSARKIVEDFVSQSEGESASIIVNHPKLQVNELVKFRSMLEIMGY